MYINIDPFWAGVLATILAEAFIVPLALITMAVRLAKNEKNANDNEEDK